VAFEDPLEGDEVTDYSSTDDGLRFWAAEDPHKRLLVCEGDALTYREVDDWVDRVAHLLHEAGAKPGDRIGVFGPNSIEWCIAGFAVLRTGAVLAPIGDRSPAHEVLALTEVSGTDIVFVGPTHEPVFTEALNERPSLRSIPLGEVSARRRGERRRFTRPLVDNEQVAAIIYSSGSTGLPKGVALSMRALLSMIQEWALVDPAMGRQMRFLAHLPLSPMGGFFNGVLRPSVVGGTTWLQPKFEENAALALLVEEKINVLTTVPLVFQRLSALPAFRDADLSHLTMAGIGGAPVPLDEFDKWKAKGVSLRQIYGSTEAGGHFSAMSSEGARDNPERCGRGNIFRRIRIVDWEGHEVGPNEDGQILVTGPALMTGYWGNQQATDAVLKNGWLYSGDLGQMDENGYFKVTDRIKEVIISGGFNVGPTEVETAIIALEGVEEVAVVPVDDERWGEAIGAFVYATKHLTPEDIVAHCRTMLASYKVPRYLLLVDEPLPRSEQGKFAKMSARRKWGEALRGAKIG
jgi:fatty-acyl-CoA synthase